MKAIMQSINPEHVFNMRVSGKRFPLKRIEVRKSAPDETPFKAYIYETKQKPVLQAMDEDDDIPF